MKKYVRVQTRQHDFSGLLVPKGAIYGREGNVLYACLDAKTLKTPSVRLHVCHVSEGVWYVANFDRQCAYVRAITGLIHARFNGRIPKVMPVKDYGRYNCHGITPAMREVNYDFNARQFISTVDDCDRSPVVYNPYCFNELYRNAPQPGRK